MPNHTADAQDSYDRYFEITVFVAILFIYYQ